MDLLTIKNASQIERKRPTKSDEKNENSLEEYIVVTNLMKKSFERSLERITDLQEDVKQKVDTLLDNWEELKNNLSQTPNAGMGGFVVNPKSGITRVDENGIRCIHIGKGIWMEETDYNEIVWTSNSASNFVRNMGFRIFGEEMKNLSVTGMATRTGEKKKTLDPTKCIAIREMVDFYLRDYRKWTNEVKIVQEMNNVGYYLGVKIGDMKKKFESCNQINFALKAEQPKGPRTDMAGKTKKIKRKFIKRKMKGDDLEGLKPVASTSEFNRSTDEKSTPGSSGNNGDNDSAMEK